MFKHILVPTDGSKLSDNAVKQAMRVAMTFGAKMTAVHVIGNYRPVVHDHSLFMPENPQLRKHFEEQELAQANKILERIKKTADAASVDCKVIVLPGDAPYEAITKQAKKAKCDLIVMASHGRRGFGGLLLGSETQKVLTHTKIPVLVCR